MSSNDKELLNVMRLADGVDVMKDGSQYTEMAQLALAQGLPGEAQSILEKGQQKGAFAAQREKDLATRLLSDAKQAVTLDKSTLAPSNAALVAQVARLCEEYGRRPATAAEARRLLGLAPVPAVAAAA